MKSKMKFDLETQDISSSFCLQLIVTAKFLTILFNNLQTDILFNYLTGKSHYFLLKQVAIYSLFYGYQIKSFLSLS